MSIQEQIQEVIAYNKKVQEYAKKLNNVAGEEVFPVMTREELKTFVIEQLAGARSQAEVVDAAKLRLPLLDEEMAILVLDENPYQIKLAGQSFHVDYRGVGFAPQICLALADHQELLLGELPENVKLPGGRVVEFQVKFGYYDHVSNTNLHELQQKVARRLNQKKWDTWSEYPEISLPDHNDPKSFVAEVSVTPYGTCVLTGDKLLAYGAVCVKGYRYRSDDPWFEDKWFQSKEEAEAAREKAVVKLKELQQEAQEKMLVEELKYQAEAAKEDLSDLLHHEYWYNLNYNIKREVDQRRYENIPYVAAEIEEWIQGTKTLKAKVINALADVGLQIEEENRIRVQAESKERSELDVILAVCNDDLHTARLIRDFADHVKRIKGLKDGLAVLEEELTAPYGRARRQEALSWKVPGIDCTDGGAWMLNRHRASDFDMGLEGAICWLQQQHNKKAKAYKKPDESVAPGKAADLSNFDLGNLFGGRANSRRK